MEVTQELIDFAWLAGACSDIDTVAAGTHISELTCDQLAWCAERLPRDVIRQAVGDVPACLCGTFGDGSGYGCGYGSR